MSNINIDPERFWREIEESGPPSKKPKKKKETKSVWENPLQEKYNELTERYRRDYGRNTGDFDCERLLDDLYAFERVFRVMKWNKTPKQI
jgi:hypothetical protein